MVNSFRISSVLCMSGPARRPKTAVSELSRRPIADQIRPGSKASPPAGPAIRLAVRCNKRTARHRARADLSNVLCDRGPEAGG